MSVWLPWLYQYGVGGVIFLFTVYLLISGGALKTKHLPDRLLLLALSSGLLGFAAIHALWIAFAAGDI